MASALNFRDVKYDLANFTGVGRPRSNQKNWKENYMKHEDKDTRDDAVKMYECDFETVTTVKVTAVTIAGTTYTIAAADQPRLDAPDAVAAQIKAIFEDEATATELVNPVIVGIHDSTADDTRIFYVGTSVLTSITVDDTSFGTAGVVSPTVNATAYYEGKIKFSGLTESATGVVVDKAGTTATFTVGGNGAEATTASNLVTALTSAGVTSYGATGTDDGATHSVEVYIAKDDWDVVVDGSVGTLVSQYWNWTT